MLFRAPQRRTSVKRVIRRLIRSRTPVVLLLALHAWLLAYGAAVHAPTRDEPTRLTRGLAILHAGRYDLNRGNPPLVEMTAALPIAVLFPDVELPPLFYLTEHHAAREVLALFTLSRLACIPYSLVGALVVWRWAKELYGPAAGLVSLSLWCLSPMQLAFGQQITCDAAAAAFGVLAGYVFWRWLRVSTWSGAWLAGVAMGLAELSKMIWIILFVLWPMTWLLVRALGPLVDRSTLVRQAAQMALIVSLGIAVVNAGYAFDGTLRPLQNYPILSAVLLGGLAPELLKDLPIPLPQHYLGGLEDIADVTNVRQWSYMHGEWKEGGWPYYYLYALLVKMPVGALALLAASLGMAAWAMARGRPRRGEWFLLIMAGVVAGVVSSLDNWSHHFRYFLPALPFAYILMGRAARQMFAAPSPKAWLAGAAWAACIVESLSVYPHSLSFFNRLAGGPEGGHRHLINSNLDWGQDLYFLAEWVREHPDARPLHLAYFGAVDPRLAGIAYRLPPPGRPSSLGFRPSIASRWSDDRLGPRPGWYAVSMNFVMGTESQAPNGEGRFVPVERGAFDYFQHFTPVDRAGYSISIYQITTGQANRVRKLYGLPELTDATGH